MRWSKRKRWCIHCGEFTFRYDTAFELGQLVAQSGCKLANPYDPVCTDFDGFNEGKLSVYEQ